MNILNELKWSAYTVQPNIMHAPCNAFNRTEESRDIMNECIAWCEENIGKAFRIQWTPSGGMKKNGLYNRYGIRTSTSTVELIIYYNCRLTRVQFRTLAKAKDENKIYGRQSFYRFCKILKDFGIDIDDYKLSANDGIKEKAKIPAPKISFWNFIYDKVIDSGDVHHLDLNSSYLSGMKEFEPKWGPALDYMYDHRKDDEIMKSVMVQSYGMMQSISATKAGWAHFSRAGVEWNNSKIDYLSKQLVANGDMILGYNTDGIWYQGPIYHDDNEGYGLGKWKNDYTNCQKFRAKSNGAYEFIDNDGNYHPVLRGTSSYEKIVPRENWEFGDIYKGHIIDFIWNKVAERIE